MELRRPFRLALAVAVLAAGGYVGFTQVSAAHERAAARRDAVEEAKYRADVTQFEAKATALLAKLHRPEGFTSAGGSHADVCRFGIGISSCFLTVKTPRPALDAMLDAARPLGLKIRKSDCKLPEASPRVVAMFGSTPPCSASGTLGGLPLSVTAFPQRDRSRSTKGHVVFSGTQVSVTLVHV